MTRSNLSIWRIGVRAVYVAPLYTCRVWHSISEAALSSRQLKRTVSAAFILAICGATIGCQTQTRTGLEILHDDVLTAKVSSDEIAVGGIRLGMGIKDLSRLSDSAPWRICHGPESPYNDWAWNELPNGGRACGLQSAGGNLFGITLFLDSKENVMQILGARI